MISTERSSTTLRKGLADRVALFQFSPPIHCVPDSLRFQISADGPDSFVVLDAGEKGGRSSTCGVLDLKMAKERWLEAMPKGRMLKSSMPS